jgi:hypothetical protein
MPRHEQKGDRNGATGNIGNNVERLSSTLVKRSDATHWLVLRVCRLTAAGPGGGRGANELIRDAGGRPPRVSRMALDGYQGSFSAGNLSALARARRWERLGEDMSRVLRLHAAR